nr:uncharacterized protein LOC105867292 isoform X1 [Microcebus murinus]XP_012612646.1 uncharacterized protein LOC105867292 isoform X1 [Microcebus murinus]XP_012612665.1 uncharacterized protein LOC105867292 isoform X1 [Microcebus murinus]XP_012612674.1 uncharacterized protein LOC105867292 isoform X1 [Microcebus murinus]XP_012612684.1 uncharacterized protein LOC105867292 isoform X1 [Microcebus murinus]XP_020143413.1 uncharacterized protein LOC105867292 isoform X1 [Microcebus murinus]XP_02014341
MGVPEPQGQTLGYTGPSGDRSSEERGGAAGQTGGVRRPARGILLLRESGRGSRGARHGGKEQRPWRGLARVMDSPASWALGEGGSPLHSLVGCLGPHWWVWCWGSRSHGAGNLSGSGSCPCLVLLLHNCPRPCLPGFVPPALPLSCGSCEGTWPGEAGASRALDLRSKPLLGLRPQAGSWEPVPGVPAPGRVPSLPCPGSWAAAASWEPQVLLCLGGQSQSVPSPTSPPSSALAGHWPPSLGTPATPTIGDRAWGLAIADLASSSTGLAAEAVPSRSCKGSAARREAPRWRAGGRRGWVGSEAGTGPEGSGWARLHLFQS